jgi:hypothetical protein
VSASSASATPAVSTKDVSAIADEKKNKKMISTEVETLIMI